MEMYCFKIKWLIRIAKTFRYNNTLEDKAW